MSINVKKVEKNMTFIKVKKLKIYFSMFCANWNTFAEHWFRIFRKKHNLQNYYYQLFKMKQIKKKPQDTLHRRELAVFGI